MRRFLVTGGAGFIGSHLCELLLDRGDHVIALDDLSTGYVANIEPLLNNSRFQFVQDSVENTTTVSVLMAQVDAVFHLAAAVGVQLVVDEPVRTIQTTIRGTEVVLDAAHRFHRPVLITSSSEVYGKGARVPFSEDDDVVMGATRFSRWCYAYSKGIDEFLGLAYHAQFNLKTVIVRLFNTVGPRQVGRYGMVVPRFVDAALAGKPLQVFGDGTQSRCFCHVKDVAPALLQLLDHPETAGEVYNLGSEQEVSIMDLAKLIIDMCSSQSEIEIVSYEAAYGRSFDDLQRRVPDLAKIRRAIEFAPRYNLSQLIGEIIEQRMAALRP